MSDFYKKFKSIFIEESTPKQNKEANTEESSKEVDKTQNVESQPNPQEKIQTGYGAVSQKFMEVLFQALEKNNQDGFDYFEYKQSLRSLAKMPMDEKTRFQSAYAMASTMGTNPIALVESASFYISVLKNEKSKFDQAHKTQRDKLIGNREQEIAGIDEGIKQKAEQIKRLTEEINQEKARKETLQQEIEENTLKIQQTNDDFQVTLEALIGQIEGDIGKIQEYLK